MTTTNTDTLEGKQLEKLARMELNGVSRTETAKILGISESRITQILDDKRYQEIESIIAAEFFEQQDLVNRGWDSVEAFGLQQVITHLQHGNDPEFALKASVYANKASKRGGFHQRPIQQQTGGKAIIHLQAQFIEKLEQNFQLKQRDDSDLVENPKKTNFMGAKAVQNLLQIDTKQNTIEMEIDQPAQSINENQSVMAKLKDFLTK